MPLSAPRDSVFKTINAQSAGWLDLLYINFKRGYETNRLLYSDGFGQITWLVHIQAAQTGYVVGQQL